MSVTPKIRRRSGLNGKRGLVEREGLTSDSCRCKLVSFPGGKRFHFTGPSGNQLAVWSEK